MERERLRKSQASTSSHVDSDTDDESVPLEGSNTENIEVYVSYFIS